MNELLALIFVGVALSMDAFSLSLGIGTFLNNRKKILILSIFVGIMHFIMPLLGKILGSGILNILPISPSILLAIILFLISIEMFLNLFKNEDNFFELNYTNMFILSLSVSIDSFTTGMGLRAITDNNILASVIFSLCSFTFTYLGLSIGNYVSKHLGVYANILGIILLITLGLKSLFV